MEEKDDRGAVRVGIVWGGIGGVVGLLVSLLGSFAGIIAAAFIGFSCGRRAADADAGTRSGALSGLIGGALAAPVFVLGAAAGAVISAQRIGREQLARTLSEFVEVQISAEAAWNLYLLSLVFAGFLQAGLLIGVSALTGALVLRKRRP
ncbi:MAG: hypothetical protein ACRDSJ_08410 [Rubrobacteraceae bacterium]